MLGKEARYRLVNLIFSFCLTLVTFHSFALDTSSELAEQLNSKAYEKLQQGFYHESYKLALQAKLQSELEFNTHELVRALRNQASNLLYLGENKAALNLYNQSLELAESTNDYDGVQQATNNIATIYNQLGNYHEALNYREKQYLFSLEESSIHDQIVALAGLSESYLNIEDLAQAQHYHKLAFELLEKEPNAFLEVYLLMSKSDLLLLENNQIEAINAQKSALEIAQAKKFNGLIVTVRSNTAELYFKLNDFVNAQKESLAVLDFTKKLGLKAKELQNHQLLAQIYESQNDFRKALMHTQLANEINKTISGKKVKQLAEITKIDRRVVETEEQLRRSKEQQKITELKLETQKKLQIVWAVIFLTSAILIFFWFYRKSTKKEILRHQQVNQELKELDKLKDRILTNTSHELRTPLNGIIGLSDIILAEYEGQLDVELQQSIELIGKSGHQLSEIVNDILDLAQLKANKMSFRYQTFNLPQLIRDAIALCKPLLLKTETSVIFEPEDDNLEITQDKKRVQQILFNIIGNALKFTPAGSVKVKFKVDNDLLYITIKDTGIGIPTNRIDRIFEGFEQVNASNTRTISGSGLGLAISKELAQALGGDITIKSELDEGTTVSFYFPIKKGTSSAHENLIKTS